MDNDSIDVMNRVPPNDQEAELAVLSASLLDREALSKTYDILQPDDFYRPDYRLAYEAMTELFRNNKPVDLITLKNRLEEMGVYEKVGGRELLANIAGFTSTSANVEHYAKIVSDKAMLRRLISTAGDISSDCYAGAQQPNDILDSAEKAIFDISRKRNSGDFVHIYDSLSNVITLIQEASKNEGHVTGVPTGFSGFDKKTAGLHPSELILIAARPSMGKTAIGLNIALHAAMRKNIPTAIFSLEMSNEQVVNRLLCTEAMVEANKLRTGQLNAEDWQKIAQASGPLSEAPIYLDDTAGISVAEVRAKCRQLKLKHGLGLVVIDYLQLMSGSSSRNESRQQEISEISRSLKAIAREIEAPVIALAQLSRACEQRADHRPILSDLRESGAIEQDADVVSFIYRDEYYNPDTEKKGIAELIIAKQRNGETGTVELMYMGNYVKFADKEHIYT